MRISDWSSDVCSSDLLVARDFRVECERLVVVLLAPLLQIEAGMQIVAIQCGRFALQCRRALIERGATRIELWPRCIRSAERRVGAAGDRPCRSRWAPYH